MYTGYPWCHTQCEDRRIGAVAGADFRIEIGDMPLYCPLAQHQLGRNLVATFARGNQV